MSSRALRRLQKQREEEAAAAAAAAAAALSETESSSDESDEAPVRRVNAFAALGGENESANESESESESEGKGLEQETPAVQPRPAPAKTPRKASRKTPSKPSQPKPHSVDAISDADLDSLLSNLQVTPTPPPAAPQPAEVSAAVSESPLLGTPLAALDPDVEYRRLFGRLSKTAIADADSSTSASLSPEQLAQLAKLRRLVRGWGGRDHRSVPGTTRKLALVKIRDDWIPTVHKQVAVEELTQAQVVAIRAALLEDWMDVIRSDSAAEHAAGVRHFRFTRAVDDRAVNLEFYCSTVVAPDHEALIRLMQQQPYHVETLLQVATILQRQGDKSNTSGLVERALFVFDRALTKQVELGSGLVRLPFVFALNRQFYLACFRYILVLGQRLTYATALAWCKLLWLLAPEEDPYGVAYFVDYYAIQAGEYLWLVKAAEWVGADKLTPGLAFSTVLAHLEAGHEAQAMDALAVAAKAHPHTLTLLLRVFGVTGVSYTPSPFEALASETYLVRAATMWSRARQEWLVAHAPGVAPQPAHAIPTNLLRFAILSGEERVMAKVPAEIWEDYEVYDYDVLPPSKENPTVDWLVDHVDGDLVAAALASRQQHDGLAELMRQAGV